MILIERNITTIALRSAWLFGLVALLITRVSMAQQSPHGDMKHDCKVCHGTTSWTEIHGEITFDHAAQTGYALIGRHAGVRCIECHTSLEFAEVGTNCLDCHVDVHRGQFSNDCAQCHSPKEWIDRAQFEQMHEATRFPLVGLHRNLDCQACHANGQYVSLPVDCKGCHIEQFAATTEPNHAVAGFSMDCQQCHSIEKSAWKDPSFAHTPAFPLTGGHHVSNCTVCHANGYETTSSACVSCHEADYSATQNPRHELPVFPTSCEECHTTQSWQPAQFTRHEATHFPLTGAHVQTDCAQCHVGGQYTGTPTDCWSCHDTDYSGTTDPNHAQAHYPQDCAVCHSTSSWEGATFDHNATQFPLTGAHVQTDCAQCHVSGYTGTPTDCWSCHEADYSSTTDPNHVQEQYPQTCTVCHSTTNWTETTFDHNATQFPLTGAHVQTDCAQCHTTGYTGTPTDCWSCHETDYNNTADPNHAQEQYPQNCTVCHSTTNWTETTFDHSTTQFPLTGAHVQANCSQCHANGYTGTPTDCWSCHEADYNQADDHASQGYPHDCAMCHSTSEWDESTFDHNSTQFPLTGRHVQTNCGECHIGGVFQGTPTDCWSCHEQDYNDADDPNHAQENYPHDCSLCHNTTDWDETNFNHDNTDFPLTGAHVQTQCAQCHANGYSGTPTDCWSCHQTDYNGTTDPDHAQEQYPQNCTQCHSTANWTDVTFDHNTTDFPLTGAHIQTTCAECHVGGQYSGTPTDCFFCHQTDFNNASPDHNDGYPQSCQDCHTTSNWNSNFDHDAQYFPIYSGNHRNEWNLCNECHTTAGNFMAFSCIDCHEHSDQGEVDDDHDDVPGYTYTPTSCYECHPDGSGDDRAAPRQRDPRVKNIEHKDGGKQ